MLRFILKVNILIIIYGIPLKVWSGAEALGDGCPHTVADWQYTWDRGVDKFANGNPRDAAEYLKEVKRCGVGKKTDDPIELHRNKCFKNLTDYLNTQIAIDPNSGLFTAMKQTPEALVTIPKELEDKKFVNMTLENDIDGAKNFLAELNKTKPEAEKYKYFSYTGSTVGDPVVQEAMGRLLIYAPGNPEKWMIYSYCSKDMRCKQGRNVALISTIKNGNKQMSYFQDISRTPQLTYKPNHKIKKDCNRCHQNGPLPIAFKDWQQHPEAETIKSLNSKTVGNTGGSKFSFEHLGPPIGQASDEDRIKTVEKCTERYKNHPEVGKLGGIVNFRRSIFIAMNCVSCHNSKNKDANNAGALRLPSGDFGSIIRSSIKYGEMPREHKFELGDVGKDALYQCLLQEYFSNKDEGRKGTLEKWLRETPCAETTKEASTAGGTDKIRTGQ